MNWNEYVETNEQESARVLANKQLFESTTKSVMDKIILSLLFVVILTFVIIKERI